MLFKAEWIIPDSRPPNEWPQNGNITFEDFALRYREGLPLVLKNITCVITPGEKASSLYLRIFHDYSRRNGWLYKRKDERTDGCVIGRRNG